MQPLLCRVAIAMLVVPACLAQSPADPEPEHALQPEEVLVTGEYPGPGMWKVTRPDDAGAHVLWILGDPPPLPKTMKWRAKEVEAILGASQEVLMPSALTVKLDEPIGFFKGMTLLPATLKARRSPDGAKLEQLLPGELYQRWLVQKKLYLGHDRGVERWRPLFAANKLRREAFDESGLREQGVVHEMVVELAKQHKIKSTTPRLEFTLSFKEMKSRIKEFSREQLLDVECLVTTIQLTEAISDRAMMQARAAAWATGDVAALAAFAPLPNPDPPCRAAVLNSQIAQEVLLLPDDLRARMDTLWLEAAEKSLAQNASTFAVLSFSHLIGEGRRLAALRAKGYVVESPSER